MENHASHVGRQVIAAPGFAADDGGAGRTSASSSQGCALSANPCFLGGWLICANCSRQRTPPVIGIICFAPVWMHPFLGLRRWTKRHEVLAMMPARRGVYWRSYSRAQGSGLVSSEKDFGSAGCSDVFSANHDWRGLRLQGDALSKSAYRSFSEDIDLGLSRHRSLERIRL